MLCMMMNESLLESITLYYMLSLITRAMFSHFVPCLDFVILWLCKVKPSVAWSIFTKFFAVTITATYCNCYPSELPNDEKSQSYSTTVFENHRKSLIQHCERSELCLILSGQKLIENAKNRQFGDFLKRWIIWSSSVTRHVNYNRTKIDGKCQN